MPGLPAAIRDARRHRLRVEARRKQRQAIEDMYAAMFGRQPRNFTDCSVEFSSDGGSDFYNGVERVFHGFGTYLEHGED